MNFSMPVIQTKTKLTEELNKLGKKYSCWDRIIMTVNQTNNYGLSWWKPTWIIFFITQPSTRNFPARVVSRKLVLFLEMTCESY